jgi:hypothetical protein
MGKRRCWKSGRKRRCCKEGCRNERRKRRKREMSCPNDPMIDPMIGFYDWVL